MSDVNCPYCGYAQEINHDDGYGYDEGDQHEQHCISCEKEFKFTTSIVFHYNVYCSGEHDMEWSSHDNNSKLWVCTRCEYCELRK